MTFAGEDAPAGRDRLPDERVAALAAARARSRDWARKEVVEARHCAGFLMPRERIALLLDEGSGVEYGGMEAYSPTDGWLPTKGGVDFVGTVHGYPVITSSTDYTDRGGGYGAGRIQRLIALAHEHRWPVVLFADGGGSRATDPLAATVEKIDINGSIGRFGYFDGMAELSGWVPTIAIVSGPSYAGHASLAGLSNLVIATRGSSIGMGGPPMVEAALGIRLTHQELAPVEMHELTGGIDLLVDDEPQAIAAARRILSFLHDLPDGQPSFSAARIGSLVPDRGRYDMHEVIDAIVDDASAFELRPKASTSVITAFARVGGRTVGVLASQPASEIDGAIDQGAADKIARFVELCDAYERPMLALVDTPGFVVSAGEGEQRHVQPGITRHHARPLLAHHHRTVPLFSVQIGRGHGLASFAMTGFGNSASVPALRLAWPSIDFAAATGARVAGDTDFDDVVEPAETRQRVERLLRLMGPPPARTQKKRPVDTW